MFLSSLYCCRHYCLVYRISREPEPLPPFLLVRGVHFFPTLLNFCAKDSLLFFSFSSRRFERSFRSYIQIGVLLKREGEKKRSWSKRRWKRGIPEGGINPSPAAYPSRREAIIFSAPKARYVSMRIRLYRSNANSDSTGSDLRIEDYHRPPRNFRFSSQRRLKRCGIADTRDEFPFSSLSLFFLLSPGRFHSRHVCSEKNCTPPLSLFSKGNS